MIPLRSFRARALHAVLVAGVTLLTGISTANATISQVPLFVKHAAPPVVMLTMSNDHQLFYKAYDDYSDVDGDGIADTTYKHFKSDGNLNLYYGYFDPKKCYSYSTTNSRFEPAVDADSTTNYCAAGSTYWSGNFLNWAAMSRMDTVRKMLYGGKRSTDTSTTTVLERAFLPNDAHSWAKFYNGSDLNKLTPFSSASGITLCNTTVSTTTSGSGQYSQNVTANPLIRVAEGNYSLWAANERWQCRWSGEKNASNSNDSAASGIPAASSNPDETKNGLGAKNYVARVQVCVAGKLGTENCLKYPTSAHLKPIGLLQTYGEQGNILFGLMTGSYGKNKSGGVLRKNAKSMADEINIASDGTFKTPPTDGNIIGVLNAMRLYGYTFDDGFYNDSSSNGGDNCTWGLNSFSDGACSNWGNPQAEIYLETLRYLAGQSANSTFNVDDTGRLSGLVSATWTDPMPTANWCGRLNVINFNASTISYDADQLGTTADVLIGTTGYDSLDDRMDAIASAEGITGNNYFVGENGSNNNQLCTSKVVSDLADVRGTCPDAPRLSGSYYIAGLAYHARAAAIRSFPDQDEDGNPENKQVVTYGVALAPAVPVVSIPIPGVTGKTVSLLPACRNSDVGGNCALVDFKIVEQDTAAGTGKIYVNWEDSEQGGDYDQDMWGTISWSATSSQISVTTDVIAESTIYDMGFGYVLSGTTQDGFHAHSGIEGFSYTDPTGVTGCTNCQVGDAATTVTYNLSSGTSVAGLLKPPLWYAAKYGGFVEDDAAANDQPNLASEWDSDGDGTPDNYYYATNPAQLESDLQTVFRNVAKTRSSAASVVANSVTLETNTFIYQAQFNSGEWSGDLLAYAINPNGSVQATPAWSAADEITTQGSSGRTILTHDGTDGVAFSWAVGAISTAQRDLLDLNPLTTADDNRGEDRLNWLRGDQSEEVVNGGDLRTRTKILGDIVNSTPYYVSKPSFFYPDTIVTGVDFTTNPDAKYSQFRSTYDARTPVIYVGANDGMLHGIRATDGQEVLAYVPGTVFPNLAELTATNYQHQFYVNSSPTVGDAFFGNSTSSDFKWHSVLVSGLGQGGKGIFALDVTNPSNFSEANADSIVLWEKNSASTGYADLGYTLGQPAIAKMNNGKWAAIFANGYSSTNGKAVLYIADVETGDVIKSIVLESAGGNGLSTPSPADTDGDGDVDVIYAGDLKGNLWKVDVSNSNVSQWKSAFGSASSPAPLFVARDASDNRQPITVRPEVIRNPHGVSGTMVFFGTGKYFEDGDESPSSRVQTMYGIIDTNAVVTGRTSSGDGDLQQQTILAEYADVEFTNPENPTEKSYFDLRETSGTALPNTKKGWYLDLRWFGATSADKAKGLGLDGEMQVTDPIVRNGVLIFTTLIPSSQPCEAGGDGWLMELDAKSGSRLTNTPWDLNGDGRIDARDNYGFTTSSNGTPQSGKKSKVGIIQRPTIIEAGDIEYKYTSGAKQGQIEVTVEKSTARKAGRLSWEQLK